MKVKIGNKTYNAEEEPILLILSQQDKSNIAHMDNSATHYCAFPSTIDPEFIKNWMKKLK